MTLLQQIKRFRFLLKYALPHWRGWVVVIVGTLISTCLALAQPWPMQMLIDNVFGQKPLGDASVRILSILPIAATKQGLLFVLIVLGLVLFVLNAITDAILTCAWMRIGQKMVYRLGGDLFARVLRRSLIFHSRSSVGDSLARVTGDCWCVYKLVDAVLFTPAQAAITSVFMILLMLRLDVGLSLLALAVVPMMAGSTFLLGRPLRAVARLRRDIESRIHAHVHQTLTGIPVVQAFNQEDRERQQFEQYADQAIRAQGRNVFINSLGSLTSGLFPTLGTAAVLWFGAMQVLQGPLTLGELLVFLAYLRAMQLNLGKLATTYGVLQETNANMDRIFEVLEVEPEVREPANALVMRRARGEIAFDDVYFGYEPGRAVLKGVSLRIRAGEKVAVVGGTGAGKSTLASLVARLFDPDSGTVLIDGIDVRKVTLASLREQISLVMQEPFLFPVSIAENIAYGRPGATAEQIEQAARAAGAHDFIVRLPQGYDSVVGERGATLSGGERQRLSIARALLKDPPILILDEPTSSLDTRTEAEVLAALRQLMRGRTTLMIAHRLSTVRDADRIIVLEHGKLGEHGTHQELIERCGVYARLYQLQIGPAPQPIVVAG
jgi:ATP-binding cassette subfamily B protein/subfamily B ATP-binding cassette protein MsbA